MLILSSVISPASGLIDPLITLNKVVLPAPLGPINAVIDPVPHQEKRYLWLLCRQNFCIDF